MSIWFSAFLVLGPFIVLKRGSNLPGPMMLSRHRLPRNASCFFFDLGRFSAFPACHIQSISPAIEVRLRWSSLHSVYLLG